MNTFISLLPEVILALTCVALIVAELTYHKEKIRTVLGIGLLGLSAALAEVLLLQSAVPVKFFDDMLVLDGVAIFFKLFSIVTAMLVLIVASQSKQIPEGRRTEFFVFTIGSCLSMCLVASSVHLMASFVALQMMNTIHFFVAAYSKDRAATTEAAVKYFIMSAFASVLYLFACAILFQHAQTLDLALVPVALTNQPLPPQAAVLVFVLFFLSISFYIGAFPMHFWMADTLEGAPTPSSVLLSLGVPAMGFVVALRWFLVFFQHPGMPAPVPPFGAFAWAEWVAVASAATMLIGALMAFRQTSAKRMLAFLIVSHSGHLLMSLLSLNERGVGALLYSLLVDLFSLVGVFFVLSALSDRLQTDNLKKLQGSLARAVPEWACLLIFLACFLGFPPLPGFIGRMALIGAVHDQGWHLLTLVAVGSSVLAIASFAKLAYSLCGKFTDTAMSAPVQLTTSSQRLVLFSLLLPVVWLIVFADAIFQWAGESIQTILW